MRFQFPNGDSAIIKNDSVVISATEQDGTNNLFGSNGRYEFRLRRKSTQDDWHLNGLNDSKSESATSIPAREVTRQTALYYGNLPFHFGGPAGGPFLVNEVLTDPNFKITHEERRVIEGVECVSFRWKYEQEPKPDESQPATFPSIGTFWVDPANNWIILGFEWQYLAENSKEGLMSGRFKNYNQFKGVLLPSILTYSFIGPDGTRSEWTIEPVYSTDGINHEVFRLSHYGLLEPSEFAVANRFGKIAIFTAISLAIFFGAAYLIRKKRRG
jgi:hypothetical protein